MFKKGDYVVHSLEGVCEVQDIVDMTKGRDQVPYYQLASWPDKRTTVYVPVNQQNGRVRLREVLSKEEIQKIVDYILHAETEWITDIGERQEKMLAILREGEPYAMAHMTKTLMKKDLEKPLGSRDKSTLLTAQKVLFSEIAIVSGQEYRSVLRMVKQNLRNPEEPLELF